MILPGGERWAACRFVSGGRARTALARMDDRSLSPVLELPSGGDCGYPGLVYRGGVLWVSYYSSHEAPPPAGEGGRTGIYLARVRLS